MFWKKESPILKGIVTRSKRGITLTEQLEQDIKLYVFETDESTERMLETLYQIIMSENLTFKQAIKTEKGRESMYQLMLHRQWLAFQVELLRVSKYGELNSSQLGYKLSSDNLLAKNEMNILLNQFIEETSSYFESEIKGFDRF